MHKKSIKIPTIHATTEEAQTATTDPTTPDPARPSFLCRHIFVSGHRCGSPALRTQEFCYHHHTSRRRAPDPRTHPRGPVQPDAARTAVVDIEIPEDRASVIRAAQDVIRFVGNQQLDPRRAGKILYALQIVSHNLPKLPRPSTARAPLPLELILRLRTRLPQRPRPGRR
jgi:hypothetical protein